MASSHELRFWTRQAERADETQQVTVPAAKTNSLTSTPGPACWKEINEYPSYTYSFLFLFLKRWASASIAVSASYVNTVLPAASCPCLCDFHPCLSTCLHRCNQKKALVDHICLLNPNHSRVSATDMRRQGFDTGCGDSQWYSNNYSRKSLL